MYFSRHTLLATGAAAFIAAIALASASFVNLADPAVAGGFTGTPDPTIDPCANTFAGPGGELVAAQIPEECITPSPTIGRKTHTPTPEGPTETSVPVTNTPVPPTTVPATNTPTGGSQGGGVRPPDTGFGDGTAASGQSWLLIAAGVALATLGVGATAAGLRRRG